MAVDFGWRRFNFFDKNVVLDPNAHNQKFDGLKDVAVACWCASSQATFVAEATGAVFRLTRKLDLLFWKAYQTSLEDIHYANQYLFSVGQDDDISGSFIKIWSEQESAEPILKKTYRLSQVLPPNAPLATSVAVHSLLTDIVVGFADGSVLLYQGDVIKDKASRWIKVREASPLDGPVNGLALAHLPGDKLVVFIVLSNKVISNVVTNKTVTNEINHDAKGADRSCWTFDERLGQMVVANQEMVYILEAEQCTEAYGGSSRCYQLGKKLEKLQIVNCGEHLVLLTKQQALIAAANAEFMSMVTVYDVKGQYIAFSCAIPSLCRIFTVNGVLMILSSDGTFSELNEKNLNAKLDILFKKNLYDVAVGLAKNSEGGQQYLKLIHSKYGDYLYAKGDFDMAINEYKETIGLIPPSYVIKRFHEDTRLKQLCVYLRALHDCGQHNGHHTGILIQCYARLQENEKLDSFINTISDTADVDMDVAFQVLRSSGMFDKAGKLAVKLKRHSVALSVFIENMKKYPLAVKYISNLPAKEATLYIGKFGKTLYENCPDDVIKLLYSLLEANSEDVDPIKLLSIFAGNSQQCSEFIEYALTLVSGEQRASLLETIVELRLRAFASKELREDECVEKILKYVEKPISPRINHLAQLFDCAPLMEFILKEEHRDKELLQYYMQKNKLNSVIDFCLEKRNKDMWLDALVFVSKMDQSPNEASVMKLLKGIETQHCIHPLVVIDILSRSPSLKVSAVKDYIVNWLNDQEKQIEEDKDVITKGEKRMGEVEKEIDSIKFSPQEFKVANCSACGASLQLPAVHFLCKHRYHVHCYESHSINSDKCPACVIPAHSAPPTIDLKNIQSYSKFQNELKDSLNSMDVIAKYLKMGLFDNPIHHSRTKTGSSASSVSHNSSYTNPFAEFDDPSLNPFETPRTSVMDRKRSMIKSRNTNPFDDVDDTDATNPFFN